MEHSHHPTQVPLCPFSVNSIPVSAVITVLSCLQLYMNETLQMNSCVWFCFTPLNALRFIDIVAPYLSLFDANTPDAMIDHHLFIPLPIHGSLGCLHFLASMNTAAVNTDGLTFSFLGGQPPKLFSWLLLLIESSTLFILLRRMVQMTSPSRAPLSAK